MLGLFFFLSFYLFVCLFLLCSSNTAPEISEEQLECNENVHRNDEIYQGLCGMRTLVSSFYFYALFMFIYKFCWNNYLIMIVIYSERQACVGETRLRD